MNSQSGSQDSYANYRELTLRGMILGALITVIFTASNVYLGLKVGLTFASSIPAAVISMAVLKMCHDSNILENNMVQTQASAAGTLSSIIFVLPGLLMLGYWQSFPFWQTTLICAAGGILGVIFTIPLRRVMVVDSTLPYPEGVAAAEILKAGDNAVNKKNKDEDSSETGLKEIMLGSAVAGVFSFLANGLKVVADSASYWFKIGGAVFQIPMGFSLALLGAGYLVGMAGGLAILLGLFATWGIAVPYFTAQASIPENMNMAAYALDIWKNKVRFIGVGVIGVAAIWTLLSLAKPMIIGMQQSFSVLKNQKLNQGVERIDTDLSPKTMLLLTLAMVLILMAVFYYFIAAMGVSTSVLWILILSCVFAVVLIGFLVAAACGYMAGLIGSSSSPISGIGIISIVLISVMLLAIGESAQLISKEGLHFLTALAIFSTSIVLAVATISNDNLQDLKTGLLVKATPWRQQVALIIGCIVGALVISPVLELLYHAYGFTGALPRESMDANLALSAPQATLMTTIAKGIFSYNLEWTYIVIGILAGLILIVVDFILRRQSQQKYSLPVLAVGMGIYLPPSINMPIFIGAFFSWFIANIIAKRARLKQQDINTSQKFSIRQGTLFAAGLIVGESILGVVMALVIVVSISMGGSESPLALDLDNWQTIGQIFGLLFFIFGLFVFAKRTLKAKS